MLEKPISPLRQRMIDDMTARRFKEKVQKDYVRHVRTFAAFLGRSPDTATSEDLRRFQLHMAQQQISAGSINAAVAALRFFFNVTLERPDLVRHLTTVNTPCRAPVVLSQEEVARLLEAAPGLKVKAALSVAYGAGLRVSEVVALKVSDIDSERMTLRVERGKGQRDRYVMLSPQLLELLREWWRAARPQAWLFPGQNPVNPMSARQLNRAVHAAKNLAGISKRVSTHTLRHSFATHLLEQDVDIRVIQVLLGHAKLETTALYTRVAVNTIRDVKSPLERLGLNIAKPIAARLTAGAWRGLAWRSPTSFEPMGRRGAKANPGHVEPRPTEGHVGDRDLSNRRARRTRRALRGLRARRASPTIPAATATARSARARRRGNGSPSARRNSCRSPTITSSLLCRRRSARSRSRTRPPSTTSCSDPLPTRCSRSPPTRSIWARASA